jgi:hypothetical protein
MMQKNIAGIMLALLNGFGVGPSWQLATRTTELL